MQHDQSFNRRDVDTAVAAAVQCRCLRLRLCCFKRNKNKLTVWIILTYKVASLVCCAHIANISSSSIISRHTCLAYVLPILILLHTYFGTCVIDFFLIVAPYIYIRLQLVGFCPLGLIC